MLNREDGQRDRTHNGKSVDNLNIENDKQTKTIRKNNWNSYRVNDM